MSPLHASPLLRVYSTLAAFLVIAACCATVVTAVTIPTMYYRDNPVPPRWVATPLPDLHFSWQIVWDATKTNANLVGTFNYTAGDMWVSVGLKSDYQMDGLCIICYISSTSGTSCTDWKGSGYGIDQTTTLTTVVSSYYSAGGVQQVVFSRPVYANGKDLGVAAWSSAERVIWGWGPMGGKGRSGSGSGKPGTHPGQGIASSLINFQTGEVVDPVNPNTHLVPVYVALGLTAALIIGIQATVKFRIPVHHRVRTATGVVAFLTYLGLWIWYIVASMDDYKAMGRLLPAASATGDAAAACLAVLLISGSRRFIAPDLLTVSHERMVVFHATTAIVMVGSMAAHAFLMIQMFCGFSFVVRWNSTDRYANLPGLLSGIVVVLIVIISLLRHRVSYRFFRYTHGLWVLIVIFAMLHVSRLAYFCIPGLALLLLNLLYGRLVNLGSRVEGVLYDHASRVVVLDISRPYWSLFNWSGCRATGLAPGQWFYICNMSLSWAWHPISVARAQVRGGRQHLRFMIRDTGNGRWTTALAHTLADVVSQPHQSTTTVNVDQVRADVPQMSVQPLPPPPKLSTWTWIEGPFGRQQLPLETYPRIVLVSGGIGVTPHLQTLQHLAEMSAQLKAEGRAVPWTSVLWLWTFREPSLLALVSDDLAAYSNMLHAAGVDVVMHHACSGKSHEALSVAHAPITIDHFGRIDVAAQLKQWHSSFTTSLPIGMFGCGPAAFTDTLFDASADVGVHVHIEVFEV